MELILESTKLLKKSMEIISDLVIEGTICFKKDYIEIVALNTNNVVMVIFRLLSTNFEKYDVKEEKSISLNLEHLSKVLKSCDEKSPLTLSLEDEGKLKVISDAKIRKEFELSLTDFVGEEVQKVPNLEFPIKVVIQSSQFTKVINNLNFLEEAVNFKASKKSFIIEGRNNSLSGKVEFNDEVSIDTKEKKTIECKYAMEYLKKFIKAENIVDTAELSFNKDYPLKVEFKILDRLLLGFILAPRGED